MPGLFLSKLSPGTYTLSEGILLIVSSVGDGKIEVYHDEIPNEAMVREKIHSYYRIAVTIGKWRREKLFWVCNVTSALTARKR